MIQFLFSENYVSLTNYDPMDSTEQYEDSIGKALQSQFDDAVTPLKENPMSEFIRFTSDNTTQYMSPASRQLHKDIYDNSPAKICRHDTQTIQSSRKNMLENIQYILDYGNVPGNAKAADIFDDMEKYIEKAKIQIMELNHVEKLKTPPKGRIEFAAFNLKKSAPQARLKGPGG